MTKQTKQGWMPKGPSRFNDMATNTAIAGFGYTAAILFGTAGVFAGHQT